ncbi:coiled-coil domain-containing protein 113 [Megalops cyprinoides]|uniref:coiled-coil domain-containing protein 113 n=1 Tax=Megalops cyprinoides TaxID=118141 RepID=UPI001864CFDE|nr:coiled-coil domain-containing protein 113 [Megalops cyprinoides]
MAALRGGVATRAGKAGQPVPGRVRVPRVGVRLGCDRAAARMAGWSRGRRRRRASFGPRSGANAEAAEAEKLGFDPRYSAIWRSNGDLRAETEMFERFLGRLDSKDAASLLSDAPCPGESGASRGRKAKARALAPEKMPRLTAGQKCEVAQREQEELRLHLRRRQEGAERVLHDCQATLEEAETRMAEVKKAAYEFERDIARPVRERRGIAMETHKIVRYMEDRMKTKDTLAEKLRLKTAALRAQERALRLRLRQKEEAGDALHDVDFQQLRIRNAQHLRAVERRNQELLALKLLAGSAQQTLNAHKGKLQEALAASAALGRDTAARGEALTKIAAEATVAEKERAEAEALNSRLRRQLADYSVPEVAEYIAAKRVSGALESAVRVWERKVEICEMTLRNHARALKKLQSSSGPGDP